MKANKILGLIMAGAVSVSLIGCGGGEEDSIFGAGLDSIEDVYGMSAVTTAELLSTQMATGMGYSVGDVALGVSFSAASEADTGSKPTESELEEFDRYRGVFDKMMADDSVTTELVDNTDEGYSDYAKKLVITMKGIDGEDITRIMYYNEELLPAEPDDDDDDRDFFEETVEEKYVVEGILIMDGVEYTIRGMRGYEVEGDEIEDELYIRAYLNEEDTLNYVEVRLESESEDGEVEKEYVYRVYSNGALVEETVVDYEEYNKKTEIEIEFINGKLRGRYRLKKELNGDRTVLKVHYADGDGTGSFIISDKTVDGDKYKEYRFDDDERFDIKDKYRNR